MLPNWAQLLDLAARLCPVPEETREWFSRFTNSWGVDDSRTIIEQAELLRTALREHQKVLIAELQQSPEASKAFQVFAAWEYALDTMLLQASDKKTCSWRIEGIEEGADDTYGGGDITLRRI